MPGTGDAPSVVSEPRQIALLAPAVADGTGYTVITTLFEFEHPVAVMVSITV